MPSILCTICLGIFRIRKYKLPLCIQEHDRSEAVTGYDDPVWPTRFDSMDSTLAVFILLCKENDEVE
jgi:hypothetical protein